MTAPVAETDRAHPERDRDRDRDRPDSSLASPTAEPLVPDQQAILDLQSTAGNAAVSDSLAGGSGGAEPPGGGTGSGGDGQAGSPAGPTGRPGDAPDGGRPARPGPGDQDRAAMPAPDVSGPDPAEQDIDLGGELEGPTTGPGTAAGIDPVLVDDELAEHERWGAAAGQVGQTGSTERAWWIAEQVGGGLGEGAAAAGGAGLAMQFTSRAAIRLAARRLPIPVIGQIIGGVFGGIALYKQVTEGGGEILGRIGAIGEGASGYEKAANTIEGIATILDVASNVLDTVGLVCGVIAAIAWAGVIPSFGASTPIAAGATKVGIAAAAASAVLSLLKTALLPLVVLFRSLHSFTTDADPRAVQARGQQLSGAAAELGGVLGGFAANKAGGAAADRVGLPARPPGGGADYLPPPDRGTRSAPHPEGPQVTAVEPAGRVIDPTTGRPAGSPPPQTDSRLYETMDRRYGELGSGVLYGPGPDGRPITGPEARYPGARTIYEADGTPRQVLPDTEPSVIIREEGMPPGSVTHIPAPARPASTTASTPETDVDWNHLTGGDLSVGGVRKGLNLTDEPAAGYGHPSLTGLVDPRGRPIEQQRGPFRGEQGQVITDPVTGRREWKPEAVFGQTPAAPAGSAPGTPTAWAVRVGKPGAWVDKMFPTQQEAVAYARSVAAQDPAQLRSDSALPHGWAPDAQGQVWPGNRVDQVVVHPVAGGTPYLSSTAGPQPEGLPGPGRPDVLPGGGTQIQLPSGTLGQQDRLVVSPLDPEGTAYRAGTWGEQTNQSRPLGGPTVEEWGAASGAARAGGLARDALTGEESGRSAPDAIGTVTAGGASVGPGTAGERLLIEPVGPDYEQPPGTPEQLAAMRSEIAGLLVCRDQAAVEAGSARRDEALTQLRSGQLDQVGSTVTGLGASTDSQGQQVDTTAQANQSQQQRQQDAGGTLGDASARLAGMGVLQATLSGWVATTGYAAGVVGLFSDSGAAKIWQSNADARSFMAKLTEVGQVVRGQQGQYPLQMGRLNTDQAALTAEGESADATRATVDRSGEQVNAMRQQNQQDAQQAAAAQRQADGDGQGAGTAADNLQTSHDQLATNLQSWALRHAEQRRLAVATTADRLIAAGYEVRDAPTW